MEQSKTEKCNTKEEMSVVKAERTEVEKAMIARFLKRDERKALKFKKGPAGNQLAAVEKDQTLYSTKMMEAFGTPDTELQTYLLNQVLNTFQNGEQYDQSANNALALLNGIQPRDEIEGMLAAQMIGIHNLAMDNLRRANIENHLDWVRMRASHAVKLMKVFTDQMEALKKYRTGGQQKMIVEHLHIN